ncbi:MAG: DUF2306 domain-containing protein, partial [Verrucomicrobia bacterium]|nr:DUF2306 domain-containing protein [Verrucomicrobiota bacterium]
LSLVPVAGGMVRLVELGGGAEITPDNARFFAAPVSVISHIVSSVIFCGVGAFQFSPGFRRRHPTWHRLAGRGLVFCGLVSALTGLWMTLVHPPASFAGALPASYDGPLLYALRLLVGAVMTVALGLGLAAVLRRDIPRHRAWMIRGYALGLGAGTQAFTHLPWFLSPGLRGELARTLCMAAGWAINAVVAEWLIARERQGPVVGPTYAVPQPSAEAR